MCLRFMVTLPSVLGTIQFTICRQPRRENDMNHEENHKIEDYTRKEVSVRDYFLRVAHPAPNVQDELKAFMQQQTESLPVDDESQDEAKTPDLYMEEEENHRIPLRGIGIALAIAASLALVLYCLEEWRVLFRQ